MEYLLKRSGAILLILLLLCTACSRQNSSEKDEWLEYAALDADESSDELYKKALEEDVLIVYTVSTRVVQTKDSFEAAYPGLSVEVRDLRSPNLIEEVEENYRRGASECDVVLCNDNSGDFKSHLVDTGIVVPYVPADIAPHMKEGSVGEMVSFLTEAEMLLYNSAKYDSCPINNIWELTSEEYKGRIYMPNPLRSFSTYAFCGASTEHNDELAAAYKSLNGRDLEIPEGSTAYEVFWKNASRNIIFTNSSDEVVEALKNGNADMGIAVSSKLRLKELGYDIDAAYKLDPFCGCRTSFAVMIARGSRNINTAKLFIHYLLGGEDGSGDGYKPFCTAGTWSARNDIADGNPVPIEEINLIIPDQNKLISNRQKTDEFWTQILKESNNSEE